MAIDHKAPHGGAMDFQGLKSLVDYHYWARDRLLEALAQLSPEELTKDLGNSFPSIRDTLVHLYGAECIWCARWAGKPPWSMPDPSAFPDLPTIRHAWVDQERTVRGVLEDLGERGVGRAIEYRMLNGQPQAQPFWQMLQHLVNHGSYHRGQVTTMLRQLRQRPPKSMDLITFYRERNVAAVG
jgi:uncharacterized damage-inducible protein DinB